MRGNIVKRPQAVNAPQQLGKRAQNQSLMIGSDGLILADIGAGCDLILLAFFPDMGLAYLRTCSDSASMKCASSMVSTPRSRAFWSLDPALSP